MGKYVESFDSTRIYYETRGKGPAIVACNGICVSTFFWSYLADYFSPNHRVVTWDYRSHGKSGRAPDLKDLTMENNARDLLAILDRLGVEKALLTGHSMGVQTILTFCRLFPERVAGLIPVLGTFEKPISSFLHTDKFTYAFPFLYHLAFAAPWLVNGVVRAVMKDYIAFPSAKIIRFVNGDFIKAWDMKPYFRHLAKQDMRVLFGMGAHMQKNSARDLLPKIKVPVLVVAGENDLFTPWRVSREMADMIPGAELLTIPRGSHAALVEQPELMNLRIEKFIRERLADSVWMNGKQAGAGKKSAGTAKPAPAGRKKAAGEKNLAVARAAKEVKAGKKAESKKAETPVMEAPAGEKAPKKAARPKKAAVAKLETAAMEATDPGTPGKVATPSPVPAPEKKASAKARPGKKAAPGKKSKAAGEAKPAPKEKTGKKASRAGKAESPKKAGTTGE
ncbi:MAG: alpha/beta fold hydrolase [Proteobacteria bacterium]|nr:alpha/beta fold hydrolase [Pseudomonadota bacterium]